MKRRAARELALKTLFAHDVGNNDPDATLEVLWQEEPIDAGSRDFSGYLVAGVIQNQAGIDEMIRKYTIEWELERMAAVDRNIMRMALFEMLYSEKIPWPVAANEAIELAKKYGGVESARFVNGILGKIIKDLGESETERR